MSPVTARVFESLTELLDPGGRLRESLKMATEIVGVSISAATGCSQTNYFLLIHLFSSEQLQQIELQEGQASIQHHKAGAQIFLSNERSSGRCPTNPRRWPPFIRPSHSLCLARVFPQV